jgi:hypothetical protein
MNRKRNKTARHPSEFGSFVQDMAAFVSVAMLLYAMAVALPGITQYLHG